MYPISPVSQLPTSSHVSRTTVNSRHSRYADHVGIQYALCAKLRQFSYEELEFSLPQLCQLLVSVDNESMALEEFIIDLCEESVNASLLV
jgi:phosphatidylinositol 4-kinase B